MLHRKIIDPALAKLPEDRSGYFSDLAQLLEEDPRVQKAPNMVFLVLKETMALLPVHLPKKDLAEILIRFVQKHHRVLNQMIFDRRFVENPSFIRQLTNDVVKEAIGAAMDLYKEGKVDTGESSFYRISFPSGEGHFPYSDEDEEDDEGEDF